MVRAETPGNPRRVLCASVALCVAIFLGACSPSSETGSEGKIRVVATTPDVGSLVASIGGDQVDVATLVDGQGDPHAVELRPSAITAMKQADLLIDVGLGLEGHWFEHQVESLKIPEAKRLTLAGEFGTPIQEAAPESGSGESEDADHMHQEGNPHFLIDPLAGAQAAVAIAAQLTELRTESAEVFSANLESFLSELSLQVVGEAHADLVAFEAAVESSETGVLAKLRTGSLRVIADHDLWAYLAARVGMEVVGLVESAPGVAPSARALGALVEANKGAEVTAVLASGQVDVDTVRFVADALSIPVVPMASQTGSRPEATSYLEFVTFNLKALEGLLSEAPVVE